jgi:hypothetical protein
MIRMIGSSIHYLALIALCCSVRGFSALKTFDVDCLRGERIARALERAEPGDTIRIAGVCREKVIVTTDGITITGSSSSGAAGRHRRPGYGT